MGLVSGFLRRYNRIEVEGIEHLPAPGSPVVLAANHPSLADHLLILSALLHEAGTDCHVAGWRDVWEMLPFTGWPRVARWFTRSGGGTPLAVDPDGGTSHYKSLRGSMASLESELSEGRWVLIFPESNHHTLFDIDRPYSFHPGGVYLAARAGVPIVPVFIRGAERAIVSFGEMHRPFHLFLTLPFYFPAKVRLRFGPQMRLPSRLAEAGCREERRRASHLLSRAVFGLHDHASEGGVRSMVQKKDGVAASH